MITNPSPPGRHLFQTWAERLCRAAKRRHVSGYKFRPFPVCSACSVPGRPRRTCYLRALKRASSFLSLTFSLNERVQLGFTKALNVNHWSLNTGLISASKSPSSPLRNEPDSFPGKAPTTKTQFRVAAYPSSETQSHSPIAGFSAAKHSRALNTNISSEPSHR